MLAKKIVKNLTPLTLRNYMRKKRVEPVLQYVYRSELSGFINKSDLLSEEKVKETMRRHGLKNRWAGVYTALSGIPSQEYVPEDFFQIHILPRMCNLDLAPAYEDKNIYDATPMKKFAPRAVARKIEGRYFDADYNPVSPARIREIAAASMADLVVKPAIESGSGKDVWIGPAHEAFDEFMRRPARDVTMQERLEGDDFSKRVNPDSFNTIRAMTAFTGEEHVTLACALRMGRAGSKIDNQNAGGLVLGVREDGRLCDYAYDKNLNRYDHHPDSGFVFSGQAYPGFEKVKSACVEMHKYLPHFGLISWDAALDKDGAARIIELNIDWQGINLFQSALGPLFGPHKEKILKTYGIPDWER